MRKIILITSTLITALWWIFAPETQFNKWIGLCLIVALGLIALFYYTIDELNSTQRERELNVWRDGLERNDLVRVNGVVFVFKYRKGNYCHLQNNNDELYVLISDVYPVE